MEKQFATRVAKGNEQLPGTAHEKPTSWDRGPFNVSGSNASAKALTCNPLSSGGRRLISACLAIAIAATPVAGMAQYQDQDRSRASGTSATAPPPEARIDINSASVEELIKVPGMTRSWAGRIVRFRPYRTKQDLLDKGVISAEVYGRIKDSIIAHRVPD